MIYYPDYIPTLNEQQESIHGPHMGNCLREFADWAGVKIINASSFSWIDAFERPKFE